MTEIFRRFEKEFYVFFPGNDRTHKLNLLVSRTTSEHQFDPSKGSAGRDGFSFQFSDSQVKSEQSKMQMEED